MSSMANTWGIRYTIYKLDTDSDSNAPILDLDRTGGPKFNISK